MKILHLLLIAIAFASVTRAELKTSVLRPGEQLTVDVPCGTTFEIVSAQQDLDYPNPEAGEIRVFALPGSTAPSFWPMTVAKFTPSAPFKNGLFAGPLRFEIRSDGAPAAIIYRLTNSTSGLSAAGPSNTVVVPEDATGPVSILLESSTDLVNWTAAQPGTYGSSTTKRFFRLRAVMNPN